MISNRKTGKKGMKWQLKLLSTSKVAKHPSNLKNLIQFYQKPWRIWGRKVKEKEWSCKNIAIKNLAMYGKGSMCTNEYGSCPWLISYFVLTMDYIAVRQIGTRRWLILVWCVWLIIGNGMIKSSFWSWCCRNPHERFLFRWRLLFATFLPVPGYSWSIQVPWRLVGYYWSWWIQCGRRRTSRKSCLYRSEYWMMYPWLFISQSRCDSI